MSDDARLPERLKTSHYGNLLDEQDNSTVSLATNWRPCEQRMALVHRLAASYNATRSIPVAALEAGVVGRLREALKGLLEHATNNGRLEAIIFSHSLDFNGSDDVCACDKCIQARLARKAICEARSILAALNT